MMTMNNKWTVTVTVTTIVYLFTQMNLVSAIPINHHERKVCFAVYIYGCAKD